MRRLLAASLVSVFFVSSVYATTFNIDEGHSSVNFRVRHLVGKVTGHFGKFSGSFSYDPLNLKTGSTQATIQTMSINTGIEKRDNHLRAADFFDAQKFPTLSFKSTGVTDLGNNKIKVQGDLTLHGVTKPVTLDVDLLGVAKDPFGKGLRAGMSATTKINRNDFGVGPSSGTMASMVGSDVEISIEIEGVSQ